MTEQLVELETKLVGTDGRAVKVMRKVKARDPLAAERAALAEADALLAEIAYREEIVADADEVAQMRRMLEALDDDAQEAV